MKSSSLRTRILAAFAGLAALLLTLLVVATAWRQRAIEAEGFDHALSLRADSLLALCEWEHGGPICEIGTQALPMLVGDSDRRAFRVEGVGSGAVLAAGGGLAFDWLPPPDAAATPPAESWLDHADGDHQVRALQRLQACGSAADGGTFTARVVVAEDRAPLLAAAAHRERLLVLLGIATLGLFVVAGWFVARRIVGPLAGLAAGAMRVQAGQSEALPRTGRGDEVDRLAEVLDQAFARLQTAFAYQRRFAADASHELRTPLATMRAAIEVALHRPRDAADYRGTLAELLQSVTRMTDLVEGLLLLARADRGQRLGEVQQVDLAALVREVVDVAESAATARGLRLEARGPAAAVIVGDARLLRILVDNLVTNAIRYSGRPGTVTVAVEGDAARGPSLRVADQGVGINAELLPHVFDRFVRADAGRGRDQGGCGLGLAIVKAIAAQHGATCELHSEVGRGTTVRVAFPPRVVGDSWPAEPRTATPAPQANA